MAQGQWNVGNQPADVCKTEAPKALASLGYVVGVSDGRFFVGTSSTLASTAVVNCYQAGTTDVYTITTSSNSQSDATAVLWRLYNYFFPPTSTGGATGTGGGSPTAAAILINCGGPSYRDSGGQVWSADTGFTGGSSDIGSHAISGTNDSALYMDGHYGPNFAYSFRVPDDTHTVTLKFAEIYFGTAGSRVFNVIINGQLALANFDIAAQAGPFKALDKTFNVTATNGQIAIQFVAVRDNALISGLEIR
jgi:hypothetical protein